MFENTSTSATATLEALHAPVRTAHPEQGWSLLVNGVVLFDDGGAILPGGDVITPDWALAA